MADCKHEPDTVIMTEDPIQMKCKKCGDSYTAPTQEEIPKED